MVMSVYCFTPLLAIVCSTRNFDTAGTLVDSTLPFGRLPTKGLGGEVILYVLMVRNLDWGECTLRSKPQMP